MTQPAGDTATTPPSAEPAAPLLDPTLREQLAPELLAELDQHEDAESDGEPTDGTAPQQPAPTVEKTVGNEASADGDDPDGEPEDPLAAFVDLLDENPANISQIPRDQQAAAVSKYVASYQDAAASVIQKVQRESLEAGYQRALTDIAAKEIDDLFEDERDREARAKIKEFPGGEAAYHRYKGQMPPTAAEAGSPQYFQTQLNVLAADLEAHPAAKAEFQEGFQRQGYKADQASLLRVARDIGMLIAKHSMGAPDPDRVTVERRRNGIRAAAAAPKPDVSRGSAGASDELTAEKLKVMTPQQIQSLDQKKLDAFLAKAQ